MSCQGAAGHPNHSCTLNSGCNLSSTNPVALSQVFWLPLILSILVLCTSSWWALSQSAVLMCSADELKVFGSSAVQNCILTASAEGIKRCKLRKGSELNQKGGLLCISPTSLPHFIIVCLCLLEACLNETWPRKATVLIYGVGNHHNMTAVAKRITQDPCIVSSYHIAVCHTTCTGCAGTLDSMLRWAWP